MTFDFRVVNQNDNKKKSTTVGKKYQNDKESSTL